MTDFEINKRLAEIAGAYLAPDPNALLVYRFGDDYPEHLKEWSPLTDWSQLGPLMERLEAWPEACWSSENRQREWEGCCETGPRDPLVWPRSPDMKRAICLAIIAAHEEGTT